jgi:hypothetical protein
MLRAKRPNIIGLTLNKKGTRLQRDENDITAAYHMVLSLATLSFTLLTVLSVIVK